MRSHMQQVYQGGAAFMRHHFEQGGAARLWHIIDAPPTSMFVIARPETYGKPDQQRDDAALVRGIESMIGDYPWTIEAGPVSPQEIQTLLAALTPERRAALLPAITGGHQHLATTRGEVMCMVMASVLQLRDPAGAGEIVDAVAQRVESQFTQMKQLAPQMIEDYAARPVEHEAFSRARQVACTLKPAVGPPGRQDCVVAAGGRTVVIVLITTGTGTGASRATDIAAEVLKRAAAQQ
jgi:hypothetical protein